MSVRNILSGLIFSVLLLGSCAPPTPVTSSAETKPSSSKSQTVPEVSLEAYAKATNRFLEGPLTKAGNAPIYTLETPEAELIFIFSEPLVPDDDVASVTAKITSIQGLLRISPHHHTEISAAPMGKEASRPHDYTNVAEVNIFIASATEITGIISGKARYLITNHDNCSRMQQTGCYDFREVPEQSLQVTFKVSL